jgi:hypothetical protein
MLIRGQPEWKYAQSLYVDDVDGPPKDETELEWSRTHFLPDTCF